MLGACMVEVTIRDGRKVVYTASITAGGRITMPVKKARLWSPEDPHLYNLMVNLKLGNRTVDKVESYFGMRKISLGKDAEGLHPPDAEQQALFPDSALWTRGSGPMAFTPRPPTKRCAMTLR